MNLPNTKTPDQIQPLAWRINDACARLSVSRSTLYKLESQGKLRFIKVASRTLIPDSEIKRLAKGEAA